MDNKKAQIHEWDMDIYPRKLWVCKTRDINVIKDRFYDENTNELIFEGDPNSPTFKAQVFRVQTKEDKYLGYMVHIATKLEVSSCAHEAFHVADFLSDDIGMYVQEKTGNEHFAYLVGWVADKIWQVNNNKIK